MSLIRTYKHNKVARAYNRGQKPKDPVLVGAAAGASTGVVLASAFAAASAHERAQRTIGGALGGAAAGALAGKSRQNFEKSLQQMHKTHKGRRVEKLPYF